MLEGVSWETLTYCGKGRRWREPVYQWAGAAPTHTGHAERPQWAADTAHLSGSDPVNGSPCGQRTGHERRGRQRGPSQEQQAVPWGPEPPSANLLRPSCPHGTHFFLFLSILGAPLRHAPADSNSGPSAWALPFQGLIVSCTGVSTLLSLCAQHCPLSCPLCSVAPVPWPILGIQGAQLPVPPI